QPLGGELETGGVSTGASTGRTLGSGTGPTGAMLPVAGPVAVSRSRCGTLIGSGVTALLDAVSAVAADCALSVAAATSPAATSGVTALLDAVSAVAADCCALLVTAAASPDATAGAFGAVSAGPVGEAAGGGASPGGSARGPFRNPLFGSGSDAKPSPAVLAASVSKGAGARCAAWGFGGRLGRGRRGSVW